MSSFNSTFKLLVVEDSKMIRANIVEFLKADGFEDIYEAADGEQALTLYERAMFRNEPFDLIILDIQMPKMNGVDYLYRMRKKDHKTRVLMLTTENDLPTVTTAIKAGANGYVLKPFTAEFLLERIYKQIMKSDQLF